MQVNVNIKITLLGMGDARYRRIRQILIEVLQQAFAGIALEEIMDLDKILDYPIAAVPAIMMDEKVIFDQGELPDKRELEQLIRDRIAEKKMDVL
jgi:hypothetical protein